MTVKEVVQFIEQLDRAGQCGRIYSNAQGLCVEITRPGWQSPTTSTRIFPGMEAARTGSGWVVRLTKVSNDG